MARLPPPTALERVAIILAALVLAVGAIAALSGFFAGQDQAGVDAGNPGPGQAITDLGNGVLPSGRFRGAADSSPATSGPHLRVPVARDDQALSIDQELQALAAGNVVLAYDGRRPAPALRAFVAASAPPFSPALAATGQAVILDRLPGTHGIIGLAWAHLIRVSSPTDPRLAAFVSYWLGRGAPGRR